VRGDRGGALTRVETALAILITLTVIALHVFRAQHAGALWRDEAGAVQLARQATIGEVFHSFPHEAFPLLFPLTVRSYTAVFGDSDRALRLFGMMVGIALVAALWLNARAAGTVPLASLALLGFHPNLLVYGDSLRGYGLGTVLILLTFGAFARLVVRPDRRTIAVAALLAVLSVHCLLHNAALLLGLGTAAAAVGLLRRRRRVTVAALGIGLLAALSLLPYRGPLTAARDWDVLITQKLGPRPILGSIATVLGTPNFNVFWIWAALLLAAAASSILWLARTDDPPEGSEDSDESGAQLFRLLAIPAAFGAQYGLFVVLSYLPRIWYVLPLMALMASALDGLLANAARFPALRAVRFAAPILLAALMLPATAGEAALRMTNVDQIARTVAEGAGRRDLVLVNYWFYGVSFQRYYQGEARWMTLPALEDHRFHRYDLVKACMMDDDPTRDVRRAIRRTLRSGHRVWVVGTLDTAPAGQPPLDPPPAPAAATGWQDGAYYVAWSQQIQAYLNEHALPPALITPPSEGPVSGFEVLNLWVFRQWQDDEPKTPGELKAPSAREESPSGHRSAAPARAAAAGAG
jgi:hypothetical protein